MHAKSNESYRCDVVLNLTTSSLTSVKAMCFWVISVVAFIDFKKKRKEVQYYM